jgi:hypothetical protein
MARRVVFNDVCVSHVMLMYGNDCYRPEAEIQRVKANDCFAAKSARRDSAPLPPGLAAFDRTAQSASDEFSVIKRLPCENCILGSAEQGLQALTDSYALNGRVRQRLAREHRRTAFAGMTRKRNLLTRPSLILLCY